MEDEGGGSDFENNEIAAIEQQFAAMESRGNRRGEGVLGEDRGWNQFQVFYGDSLIPEESVTLIGLMKSDLFYFNCYAFAIIAILSVSLKVDWKRAQSEMKLLAIWAVINVLIHVIMFLVNYMAVALFTNYSSAIR